MEKLGLTLTTRLTFYMYPSFFPHKNLDSVFAMYPDKNISIVDQASDYRENKIHTGWLDSRIAMRVRAERPPWYLSVVGGALYVRASFSEIYICLEKFLSGD